MQYEPSKADQKRCTTNAKEVRKIAKMATHRWNRRMVRGHLKCHPPSKYSAVLKVNIYTNGEKGEFKNRVLRRHVTDALVSLNIFFKFNLNVLEFYL